MENRFLPGSPPSRHRPAMRPDLVKSATRRFARSQSVYARSLSAEQRALVVLIENGGVDLGIPELVDKLLEVLPGSSLLPESARQQVITFVRDTIKGFTDNLLESADLALNRYSAAAPSLFNSVTVLRNSTATYDDLKGKLIGLSKEGKLIDLVILTHGSANEIAVNGGVTGEKIRQMRAEYGKPLSIRSVYMMNCVGSSLNQAWLDAGAKASAGSIANNYLPEPTNYFFWQNWQAGQNFETAVNSAYRKTINLMNDAVRGFIKGLLPLGGDSVAEAIDFEKMDFVKDSAPVISGQRTVTVSTDDLSFAQSLSSTLATTVLPLSVLRSLGNGGSHGNGGRVQLALSSSYRSPSTTTMRRGEYSRQQNPVPFLIAGIEVADAIQIGLAGVALVQTQVSASAGSFQLVYDKTQRLLTPEARNKMPGSQSSKSKYSKPLMYIGSSSPIMDFAQAHIIIEWEGNPFGEIGTPVIRRELKSSTEWSKSSANLTISRLEPIPIPGTDPRAWPLVFTYEGAFDPVFNGHFEFSGEFEINAFGGLKFNRHEVVSRSLLDATLPEPEKLVMKAQDVVVPTPAIPQEQIDYLRANLPVP